MCCLYYFHEYNWQSTLKLKLQTRWARDKAVANEKNGVKAWHIKTGGKLRFGKNVQSTLEWKWTEG